MSDDPNWDRLTSPAQAAWRWAWIVTATRTGAAPADVRVDTLDLLAGMALAHLRESPVSQLLEHFRIPAGTVLNNGGARRYDADALLTVANRIPDGQMPPADVRTNEVLQYALSAMPPSPDGLVTLPMLFGALLETTNPASTALRAELADRGVEFNAWQYVEGNLWASLLEHLFRNLRRAGEEDADDLLDARRREYLTKITERTAEHRRAIQKRDELSRQHERAEQDVQQKIEERDRKLADLNSARTRNPFAAWRPSAELAATLEEVKQRTGLGELGTRADELRQTLVSTGETVRRSGPIIGALRARGWRYAIALIAVIALGPLASWGLSLLDVSAVSNVIGSLSALLAGITAYAARGTGIVSDALSKITEAQARLEDELNARREEFDQQIRQAENALAQTERALESAVVEEQQLAASVTELETELARITPSSVLAEFVGQRFTSDDYRRHLGVPALVRQDLERLSRPAAGHRPRAARARRPPAAAADRGKARPAHLARAAERRDDQRAGRGMRQAEGLGGRPPRLERRAAIRHRPLDRAHPPLPLRPRTSHRNLSRAQSGTDTGSGISPVLLLVTVAINPK